MPLPVAHGLVGASIVVASRQRFSWRESWWPLLIGATFAILPDFDLFFAWVLGYNIHVHGSFTHSILFAILAGPTGALLAREFTQRGVLIYICATLSHGILDVCTKKDYGGAQLLWPFSVHRYRLGVFSYYMFYPDPNTQAMREILEEALNVTYYEALIFVPLFLVVITWKKWQQNRVGF